MSSARFVHPVAESFRSVAELYEKARPEYPPEAFAWLAEELPLEPGKVVVDLAAGTGKLTRGLVGYGATIIAVEPLDEMRDQLRRVLPDVEALDGAAEEMPFGDASIDGITVAAAFHWFDADAALAEIGRVLRPGGALALLANARDEGDPLQQKVNDLLAPYRKETPWARGRVWLPKLEALSYFETPEVRTFEWDEPYTAAMIRERLGTISFVAALGDAEHHELMARIDAEFADVPEPFPFRYRTEVHLARRATG